MNGATEPNIKFLIESRKKCMKNDMGWDVILQYVVDVWPNEKRPNGRYKHFMKQKTTLY